MDSAANELKAARLMMQSIAPNLKAVIRDRAHAARRILSRPWKSDPFMKSLAHTFIMDRHSICQRIQHSPEFRALFADNVAKYVDGPFRHTTGLGAAKHRYESWAKPYGMMIMTLPALVRTAEDISLKRAGKQEARDADAFLDALDPPNVLQVGMMADAADETLTLIRIFDDESCDISTQAAAVGAFLKRVSLLFEKDRCFSLPGYTKASMDFLTARIHMVRKRGKVISTFGGPGSVTPSIQQACIERMRVWLRLARRVISAEFPSSELLNAFRIFNVSKDPEATHDMERAFHRLAKVFGLDKERLAEEFRKCLPIARQRVTHLGHHLRQAWSYAVDHPRFDTSQLRQIVYRYLGWGLSSSGVERAFATARDVLSQRAKASNKVWRITLEMASGPPENEEALRNTIGTAQEIWAKLFGPVRRKPGRRWDRGCQRSGKADTRTGWLRERRQQLSHALQAASSSSSSGVASSSSGSGSDGPLRKERAFQRAKLLKRKIEALEQKHLLDDEVDENLHAAASKFLKDRATRDRQAHNAKNLLTRKLKPQHLTLDGKQIFVAEAGIDHGARVGLLQRLEASGGSVVASATCADVIVVPNLAPSAVASHLRWTAMLNGTYLIMPSFGLQGHIATLKYHAATGFWRRVFVTQGFKQQRPRLMGIMETICSKPTSKWVLLPSVEAFNTELTAARKRRRAGQVVILRRTTEVVEGALAGSKQMAFTDFEASINKVDATATITR